MKFVLDVPENWHRRYLVDCPDISVESVDDLTDEQWNQIVDTYMNNIGSMGYGEGVLSQLDSAEFIDDGPRSNFLVTEIYDE